MSAPAIGVVVRVRDEARDLGRLLGLLARQSAAPRTEVVVVDLGSADGTPEVARAAGARVEHLAQADFSYGRALNVGCAATTAPVLVALSAHAFPRDDGWLERVEAHVLAPSVACATGAARDADGRPLDGVLHQGLDAALRTPSSGYSNAAGGFRAELWRSRPFDETLPFAEDKEWALHWLREGWTVALAPDLVVEHDHSRDALTAQFRRARLEWEAYRAFLGVEPLSVRELARTWWAAGPRSRLSPWRTARLLGERVGRSARAGR